MSRIFAIMLLAAGMTGGAAAANAGHLPDYAGYYGARYIEGIAISQRSVQPITIIAARFIIGVRGGITTGMMRPPRGIMSATTTIIWTTCRSAAATMTVTPMIRYMTKSRARFAGATRVSTRAARILATAPMRLPSSFTRYAREAAANTTTGTARPASMRASIRLMSAPKPSALTAIPLGGGMSDLQTRGPVNRLRAAGAVHHDEWSARLPSCPACRTPEVVAPYRCEPWRDAEPAMQ